MASKIGQFIRSQDFITAAENAVRDAIAKTEARGVKAAYVPAPPAPVKPELVRIPLADTKKKTLRTA